MEMNTYSLQESASRGSQCRLVFGFRRRLRDRLPGGRRPDIPGEPHATGLRALRRNAPRRGPVEHRGQQHRRPALAAAAAARDDLKWKRALSAERLAAKAKVAILANPTSNANVRNLEEF